MRFVRFGVLSAVIGVLACITAAEASATTDQFLVYAYNIAYQGQTYYPDPCASPPPRPWWIVRERCANPNKAFPQYHNWKWIEVQNRMQYRASLAAAMSDKAGDVVWSFETPYLTSRNEYFTASFNLKQHWPLLAGVGFYCAFEPKCNQWGKLWGWVHD